MNLKKVSLLLLFAALSVYFFVAVHAQTYLVETVYSSGKCAGPVVYYTYYQLGACIPNTFPFIMQNNGSSFLISSFASHDYDCSGSPFNITALDFDQCDTEEQYGTYTSMSYNEVPTPTPPFTSSAYQFSLYPSCTSLSLPLYRETYNPAYCFSLPTYSYSYSCNSTTAFLSSFISSTTCQGEMDVSAYAIGNCSPRTSTVDECFIPSTPGDTTSTTSSATVVMIN